MKLQVHISIPMAAYDKSTIYFVDTDYAYFAAYP